MLHRNHFPRFFVLTLLQASYEHFYYNPKAERDLDECIERGVFTGQGNDRAQIAEFHKIVEAEMRELRESAKRK